MAATKRAIPLVLNKSDMTIAARTKRQQAEESIVTDVKQLLKPPAWMKDPYARQEWKRVVPQLIEIDIVGNLDLSALAGYCNAFAQFRRTVEDMEGQPLVVEYEDRYGHIQTKENDILKTQRQAAADMRRFADQCGLTISSRLKAAQAKQKKEEDNIEQAFGVI